MITCIPFDSFDGQQIYKYVLSDKITAEIVTLGATLVSLKVPSNCGQVDVLLGLNSSVEMAHSTTYMGATVGRCANRIGNGRFVLEGKTHTLAKNDNGKAHLHGGICGFNQKVFDHKVVGDSIVLSCQSRDGEEGYPGDLSLEVKFSVSGSTLSIEYLAKSNKTTLFNPTNHAYFNLNGQGNGDVLNHILTIYADKFTPVDGNLIPTGEERSVFGSAFDFTHPKSIGQDIGNEDSQLVLAGGYDHNFCLNGNHAATVYSPQTGVCLDCFTDMPGVQLYTGNFLDGVCGKAIYERRSGFCLETQMFPDAINKPQWKQPILHSGEDFVSKTEYRFSIRRQ